MHSFLGLPDQELTPEQQAEQESLSSRRNESENSFNAEMAAYWNERNTNDERNKKCRVEGQEELEVYRPGRLLHHSEFLRLLRRIRPDAFLNDWSARGLIGVNLIDWHPSHDDKGNPVREFGPFTVTTIQAGISTEFTQIRTDRHGLPSGFKFLGWRKAVLDLITKGFITEEQAKVFGPAEGSDATRYKRELYHFRNHDR